MMRTIWKFFSCYVPNEFIEISNGVKNNTITHLKINDELIKLFGGCYEQDNVFPRQLELLGEALEKNTSIISIGLHGYLLPQCFYHLINALKKNNTVQELSIDISEKCPIPRASAMDYLASMIKVNKGLKKLMIVMSCYSDNEYIPPLVQALKKNRTLEVLEISRPHILYQESLDALSALPQFNDTLKKISLYHFMPGEKPSKEFINPAWRLREAKVIMRNGTITLFKKQPNEVINKIENYLDQLECTTKKTFPSFK